MAIQYSGSTIINNTFAPASRADLINNITSALSTAGWTTISGVPGSGSDVTMETAASNVSGKVRFRFIDPGVGNTCIQITCKHTTGSPSSQTGFINPANAWRIIANKFQFFTFMTSATFRTTARSFAAGGQLWSPSWLPVSAGDAVSFMYINSTSDADVTGHCSWRNTLRPYDNANTSGRFSCIYATSLVEGSGFSSQAGTLSIVTFQGGYQAGDYAYRWEDNTLLAYEPLVAWATGVSTSNEAKIKGQMYDAMIVNGSWASESVISYNGHTWLAITDAAASNISSDATLFIAIT